MADIKAFLIDMDDTLTRVPDAQTYHRATHAAYSQLIGAVEPMAFDAFGQLHGEMYDSGQCHFTGFAERFGLQPLDLFRTHHDQMAFDTLVFDEASAIIVKSLADRAVLFTDGARKWANRCLARLGLQLDIIARDDNDCMQPIKAGGDMRWAVALKKLSEKTGAALRPTEVLMIDDSARVLRYAQQLGFKTAQINFGNPDRILSDEFDYKANSIAQLVSQFPH